MYNAGHMVPMDKPQAASEMLISWMEGNLGRKLFLDKDSSYSPQKKTAKYIVNTVGFHTL